MANRVRGGTAFIDTARAGYRPLAGTVGRTANSLRVLDRCGQTVGSSQANGCSRRRCRRRKVDPIVFSTFDHDIVDNSQTDTQVVHGVAVSRGSEGQSCTVEGHRAIAAVGCDCCIHG